MPYSTPDPASPHAQDQPLPLTPATCREIDRHFGYDRPTPPTDAELDAMFVAECERRNEPPFQWHPTAA